MSVPTGQARIALEAVADYARLCEATAQRFDATGRPNIAARLRAQAAGARFAARRACSDVQIRKAAP